MASGKGAVQQAMTNFNDFLKEQLQDPEIKAEYETIVKEIQDNAFREKLVDGKNTSLSECVSESEAGW